MSDAIRDERVPYRGFEIETSSEVHGACASAQARIWNGTELLRSISRTETGVPVAELLVKVCSAAKAQVDSDWMARPDGAAAVPA